MLQIGALVTALQLLLFFGAGREYFMNLARSTPLPDVAVADLARDLRFLAMISVEICIVILGIATAIGIVRSHRTAGAAYAIRRTIRNVLAGDRSSRVQLRKRDELTPLAHAVNELLDHVYGERPSETAGRNDADR
jgi:signal transduction histidine kinase